MSFQAAVADDWKKEVDRLQARWFHVTRRLIASRRGCWEAGKEDVAKIYYDGLWWFLQLYKSQNHPKSVALSRGKPMVWVIGGYPMFRNPHITDKWWQRLWTISRCLSHRVHHQAELQSRSADAALAKEKAPFFCSLDGLQYTVGLLQAMVSAFVWSYGKFHDEEQWWYRLINHEIQ